MNLDNYIITGSIDFKELNKIKKDCKLVDSKSVKAVVTDEHNYTEDTKPRKGKVCFLEPDEHRTTINILYSYMLSYENVYKIFSLSRFLPETQYAIYNEGDFFKKHRDTITFKKDTTRILTMCINLTDDDDYEGGSLWVYPHNDIDNPVKLSKNKGSFIIFPSFYLHEVTPITKGKRESIVVWSHNNKSQLEKFKNIIDSNS